MFVWNVKCLSKTKIRFIQVEILFIHIKLADRFRCGRTFMQCRGSLRRTTFTRPLRPLRALKGLLKVFKSHFKGLGKTFKRHFKDLQKTFKRLFIGILKTFTRPLKGFLEGLLKTCRRLLKGVSWLS